MLAISFRLLAVITSRKEFVRLSVPLFESPFHFILSLAKMGHCGHYGRRHKSELKSKASFRANLHFTY